MSDDEFSDNEDEWYFDSIKRYKSLSMFEIQKTPVHVSCIDTNSVCVISGFDKNHSEITELLLPIKSSVEDNLSNNSDLKLKCGTFSESVISQVQVHNKKRLIFSSEEGVSGAIVYGLDSQSDQIKKCGHIRNILLNPQIALNQSESQLLLSQNSRNDSFIVDINNTDISGTISTKDNLNQETDILIPLFVHFNTVSILNRRTGVANFYDVRTNSACKIAKICPPFNNAKMWSCTSNFLSQNVISSEYTVSNHDSSRIFLLSDEGNLMIYDSRNWNSFFAKYNLDVYCKSDNYKKYMQLSCSPFDKNILAVSGFDSNVHVYRLESESRLLFMHDGHSHVDDCEKETVVSSHGWMNFEDMHQIVSCALNKTLQLWEFNL
ncbi:integrator complex assembly factor WDR73-like [Lycorma delicatula]|uniref:integrator complex assembly factor WDR73-like n=1 Tax=Lycorma delicatula TaxID=130591 RepID=UPI003F5156F0